jgi:uncharacterized protein YndB with AHSA1/START domain
MFDAAKHVPHTFYTIYIASTPEQVWQALTSAEFSRQYFFGHAIAIEPRTGGAFKLVRPDGSADTSGEVLVWDPPKQLSVTWKTDWIALPACIVTYEIAQAGDGTVKLSLTESHIEPIDERILSGGRQGWPAILSSLKSLLETGKGLTVKMEPPQEFLAALKEINAAKT